MRELDRNPDNSPVPPCAVIGAGRLGNALAGALRDVGGAVVGPLSRSEASGRACDVLRDHRSIVLLCVPDSEIAGAARALPPADAGRLVGHCSGATGLDVLAPHEALGLHPLMTFGATPFGATPFGATPAAAHKPFAGAGAAIAGTTPRALAAARVLATRLGMQPFELRAEDRAAYHAAASIASNFLVTLEAAAEQVGAGTGLRRESLVALVRQTVENWARQGAPHALTGPVARGDGVTVARQRAAVEDRAPELLAVFDALCERTSALAATTADEPTAPEAAAA